tara:strand:+ start:149 stop:628 length:480 start_codon:yes stop_codon:yes gene_type:complete
MKKLLLLFIPLFVLFGCEKESDISSAIEEQENTDLNNNPNMDYVGNWNFKGTSFSYSGYYIYTPEAEWYSTSSSTISYNDSTGSIQLGDNINELIFKYCEACDPVIYNLNDSGEVWSENLGGVVGWTLTDSTFFNIVIPGPPSYSPSYSTYDIEGWKLQ